MNEMIVEVVEDEKGRPLYLLKMIAELEIGLFASREDAEQHIIRGQLIMGDYYRRGSEHPASLLGEPHPLMRDGKWPFTVLDSPEYKQALKKYRRQK